MIKISGDQVNLSINGHNVSCVSIDYQPSAHNEITVTPVEPIELTGTFNAQQFDTFLEALKPSRYWQRRIDFKRKQWQKILWNQYGIRIKASGVTFG